MGKSEDVQAPAVVHSAHLERDPLKKSFKNFLWKAWNSLGLPRPTGLQYDMADWLHLGPDLSVTMAFRGAAKSYTTVGYCLWDLYCDPDEIVLTVSATSGFAGLNAQFAFQMLLNFDWLAHMIPRTDQRRSALAFDVAGARPKKFESFKADSLFGQITGRRATLIVPDDVETPQTSDTDGKRTLLRARYGELGGAILLPDGKIKTLGTAQNEQSLYPELVTDKGYGIRMWPILYPDTEQQKKYGSWLAPSIVEALSRNPHLAGTSTEPSRFDEADIAARELAWGRTEFDRQFRLFLDAGISQASPLKLRDFMVIEWAPPSEGKPLLLPPEMRWGPAPERIIKDLDYDSLSGDHFYYPLLSSKPEEWRPAEYVKMYVDPAGGGSDETTWTVEASLNALGFLCHQGKSLDGYSDGVLTQIAKDAKLWGVQYIKVESNFGQGMFGALLRPKLAEVNHPCNIEEDRKGTVSKEQRIVATLEPALTGHRLVLNLAVLREDYTVSYQGIEDTKRRFYRLTYQLTRLTKTKGCLAHDDRVDCYASSVQELIDLLKQRTEDARKNDREAALQEEIQRILDVRKAQGLPLLDTYGQPTKQDAHRFGTSGEKGFGGSKLFNRKKKST